MARIIKPRRTEFVLPEDHKPFTDKYFLRSRKILKRDGLNPRAKYQVFIQNVKTVQELFVDWMKQLP